MRPPWRHQAPEPPPVYVGSHDDRITRIRPLHVDPDDDGHTREDTLHEQESRLSLSTFIGALRR
jgi:hypothetical protein